MKTIDNFSLENIKDFPDTKEGEKLYYTEVAKLLMKYIQYDNGMCDRFNPETYPDEWVNRIAYYTMDFFSANLDRLTDEDLENICCNEASEIHEKYNNLPFWDGLNEVLNEYFDPDSEIDYSTKFKSL